MQNQNILKIQELVQETLNWQGVPEQVRITFKAVSESLKQQQLQIQELQSKQSTQTKQFSSNVSINDSEKTPLIQEFKKLQYELKQELFSQLNKKASFEEVIELIKNKVTSQDLDSELEQFYKRNNQFITDINNQMKIINEEMAMLSTTICKKSNTDELKKYLAGELAAFSKQVRSKTDQKEFESSQEQIRDLIDSKNKEEMQLLIKSIAEKLSKKDFTLAFDHYRKENEQLIFSEIKRVEEATKKQLGKEQFLNKIQQLEKNFLQEQQSTRQLQNEEFKRILNQQKDEIYEDLIILKDEMNLTFKELKNLIAQWQALRGKDLQETAEFIDQNIAKVNQQKNLNASTLKEILQTQEQTLLQLTEIKLQKLDKSEYLSFRQSLGTELSQKADLSEVQIALNKCQEDNGQQYANFICNTRQTIDNLKNQMEENSQMILNQLSNKIDTLKLELKASNEQEIYQTIEKYQQKKNLYQNVQDKITIISNGVKDIQTELQLKCNIKDICMLLDKKAEIDDVNKALIEIHQTLEKTITQDQIEALFSSQRHEFNKIEYEARWIWKSGDLGKGQQIPWELQIINTQQDNFIWEKGKYAILIVSPGLYQKLQIEFGFYSKNKPQVQMLVNGEAIISAINSNSYAIHYSPGKMKECIKHSQGCITGLTMIDFIILPARSRITFTYEGEYGGEGFFGIKRL